MHGQQNIKYTTVLCPAVISFPMSAVAWYDIVCVAAALQGYAAAFKLSSVNVLRVYTESAKTQ
jgi:hypothetical protein